MVQPPSFSVRGLRSFLAILSLGVLASPVVAQPSVPRQLVTEARAGAFGLDAETLERNFNTELERCRSNPAEESASGAPVDVTCSLLEALVLCFSGEREEGLSHFDAAVQTLEGRGDNFSLVLVHFLVAESERQQGFKKEAGEAYERAFAALKAAQESSTPVNLDSLEVFFRLAGFEGPVLDLLRQVGSLLDSFFLTMWEVMLRMGFGTLLGEMGDPGAAVEQLEIAWKRSREGALGVFDAEVLDALSRVHYRSDALEAAETAVVAALDAAEVQGKQSLVLKLLRRKSEIETALGRHEDSLKTLERALDVARRLKDLAEEAEALSDISEKQYALGEVDVAKATVEQALQIAKEANEGWTMLQVLVSAGGSAMATGDYELAVRRLESATAVLGRLDSLSESETILQINVHLQLSEVYHLLGRRELLVERVEAAKALLVDTDFAEADALAAVLLAWDQFLDDESSPAAVEALVAAQTSLVEKLGASDLPLLRRFSKPLRNAFDKFRPMLGTSPVAERDGQLPEKLAVIHFSALEVLGSLGEIDALVDEGRFEDAEALLTPLLGTLHATGSREFEALALMARAGLLMRMGDSDAAADAALAGVKVLEGLLGGMRVDELVRSYLGSDRRWIYDVAVLALQEAGRWEGAFDVAEKARARALLHQLGNPRLGLPGGDDLESKLRSLRSEILTLETEAGASELLIRKRAHYDEMLIRAKLEHPEYADIVGVAPSSLETLRSEAIPEGAQVISFYLSADRVFVWIVGRGGARSLKLPITPGEIRSLVALARRSGPDAVPEGGATLVGEDLEAVETFYFEKLVAPLLPHARAPQWILVPHRELHYVPFAALRDERSGRRLAAMKTLSYVPSTTVLQFVQDKSTPHEGRALVLGDPQTDLPTLAWAREEAREVADLFGVEPLLGAEATEEQVRRLGGSVDVLHIAGHGVYRPLAPRFSHLALSPGGGEDGALEVAEIFADLDLRGVDLVTLSACRTGLGERTQGDEVMGLTRAFLYAGSPAVVSSLWRVDDGSTAFLMKRFYDELGQGTAYAVALQRAQLETARQPGWSDPYFWAAFTLTGDGGASWQTPGR